MGGARLMGAYDNCPRVTANADGTFRVDVRSVPHHVCPAAFGGWVAHRVGVEDWGGLGFDTADEAIRSLIGDPQP